MLELIDRQAVLEIAMGYCPDDDGCCSKAGHDIREMLDEIEALPTIVERFLCVSDSVYETFGDIASAEEFAKSESEKSNERITIYLKCGMMCAKVVHFLRGVENG